MASLLDPRWKNLSFATQKEIERVHKLLHEECEIIKLQKSIERSLNENAQEEDSDELLINIQEDSDNCTIDSDINEIDNTFEEEDEEGDNEDEYEEEEENVGEEKNEKEEKIENEYRSIFENIQSYKDNNIDVEISNFLARPPVLDIDANPFEWWKNHKTEFPVIAHLAQKYLIIPATSVPSERLFSDAGNHITNKRGSMEPNTLKKILFLRRNKQVINIHPPDGNN